MTIKAQELKILRDGKTIYALNAMGTNLFSASVQPGFKDDGAHPTDQELEEIAAFIFNAVDEYWDISKKAQVALSKLDAWKGRGG